MTPIGTPPRRARPTTTDLPHSARYSVKEPCKKKEPIEKNKSGLGLTRDQFFDFGKVLGEGALQEEETNRVTSTHKETYR